MLNAVLTLKINKTIKYKRKYSVVKRKHKYNTIRRKNIRQIGGTPNLNTSVKCKQATYLGRSNKCEPCPDGATSLVGSTSAGNCLCKSGYQGIITGTHTPIGICKKIKILNTYRTGGLSGGPQLCDKYPVNCGLKYPKKVIDNARKKYYAKQASAKQARAKTPV